MFRKPIVRGEVGALPNNVLGLGCISLHYRAGDAKNHHARIQAPVVRFSTRMTLLVLVQLLSSARQSSMRKGQKKEAAPPAAPTLEEVHPVTISWKLMFNLK
jgi:hypothetical protein